VPTIAYVNEKTTANLFCTDARAHHPTGEAARITRVVTSTFAQKIQTSHKTNMCNTKGYNEALFFIPSLMTKISKITETGTANNMLGIFLHVQ
jgi:hypothetical protein